MTYVNRHVYGTVSVCLSDTGTDVAIHKALIIRKRGPLPKHDVLKRRHLHNDRKNTKIMIQLKVDVHKMPHQPR